MAKMKEFRIRIVQRSEINEIIKAEGSKCVFMSVEIPQGEFFGPVLQTLSEDTFYLDVGQLECALNICFTASEQTKEK